MDAKTNKSPGERVKSALKDAGITQKKFAEDQLLSPNYINQIIRGKRNLPPHLAQKVADLTGVRKEYLLGIDEFKTVKEAVQKSKDYLETFDRGVDSYIELVAILRMNMSLRIEQTVPPEKVFNRTEEAASKNYVFTNNDDSSSIVVNGIRFEKFRCDLMDYTEFLLRQILRDEDPLYYVPWDLVPGVDPLKEGE